MQFSPEGITAIVIAIISLVPWLFQAKKFRADGDLSVSSAWEKLNKPMLDRVDMLEIDLGETRKALDVALLRIRKLEDENRELRAENDHLKRQSGAARGMLK